MERPHEAQQPDLDQSKRRAGHDVLQATRDDACATPDVDLIYQQPANDRIGPYRAMPAHVVIEHPRNAVTQENLVASWMIPGTFSSEADSAR